MNKKSTLTLRRIIFIAVMAAIICVVTFFRFPLLGSKVHFANALCLLGGLMFGPVGGGLAAGLGSALYDGLFGGYDIIQCLITFVSKFAMAAVCALIARTATHRNVNKVRVALGCVCGALSYVVLYMLKTFIYQRFVYGYPGETVLAAMASKLPASLINAVFAIIVAPIIYAAVVPALRKAGLMEPVRENTDPQGSK